MRGGPTLGLRGGALRPSSMRPLHVLPLLAAALAGCGGGDHDHPQNPPTGPRPPAAPSTIADENARPGDPDWAIRAASDRHQVEGYGSRISLRAGESLDVMVNVDAPKMVAWTAYRIGW